MPSPLTDTDRVEAAVALAAALVTRARAAERSAPVRQRRRTARLARLIRSSSAKEVTFALTDEVSRIGHDRRAARHLAAVVGAGDLSGFGLVDRALLRAAGQLAPLLPGVVMPLVRRRLRAESDGVIIPAEDPAFAQYSAARRDAGVRVNVNVLGEAILGDREARHRLDLILARLARPDVDYVSVKISAVCPNVSALAFDATVSAVSDRLRELYRAAAAHRPAKFVNLDMEEYRDLGLTVDAFTRVLDEPEFAGLEAGIVLQAYLPDAHAFGHRLAEWARARHAAEAGRIKIRVVKGANLAMEDVDAEMRGWPLAPYGSKADVDASYKALLDLLLDERYDDAVRIGLASHNLFDLAWGLLAQRDLAGRGRADRLELEMLEGMAVAQADAVRAEAGDLLLYAPIVRRDDFAAAIAYLVRRLDENTSPDNFLTHVFDLEAGNEQFRTEADKFRAAVAARRSVRTDPHRTQDRSLPVAPIGIDAPFRNEPDTDFTRPANRAWLAEGLAAPPSTDVPAEVGIAEVDRAVAVALAARPSWTSWPVRERAALIDGVGDAIASRRGQMLAVMAEEAGKTVGEGDPEVSEAIDFARYYSRESMRLGALTASGSVTSTPLGTVVVTPPWNFPCAIPVGGVLAALAAGNTVILKPAPQSARTAWLVAQCCWAAGVPREVVQFVRTPDDDAGRRLVTHPDVDAVILTGSFDTAQMFLGWRPEMRLHAETSGKNALVITAMADIDLAIKDLVKSAFGHAGQKCSAASLAIVEADLYDDHEFLARLCDAVLTLRVGPGVDPSSDVGPLIGAPGPSLTRALTTLEPGETWLVEPHRLERADGEYWTPGVRLGVAPGSWFHRTECFGPVLGVMRAGDLDHAIDLQNGVDFGLTAGIHSLDEGEVTRWIERVEAGNLYVNRGTTGAIVRRQPFGGWKRSAVGPTAKAGGPNYLSTLQRWTDTGQPIVDVAATYRRWMAEVGSVEIDVTGLHAERNGFRYRPLPNGVIVRVAAGVAERDVDLIRMAAATAGAEAQLSFARDESDEAFATRLASTAADRLRVLGPTSDVVRRAAHAAALPLDDSAPVGEPSIELPHWLREQSVTVTRHRHGRLGAEFAGR